MRRPSVHWLLSFAALSGCAVPLTPPSGTATNTATHSRVGQPPEPLAGLSFKVLAPENARYAGGVGGPMPAAMPASTSVAMPGAVPMASASAPAPSQSSGGYVGPPAPPIGLTSGNLDGGYGYAYGYGYGPMPGMGGGEPMALVSLTQAETAGSKGPYLSMTASVIQPVLKDWADDAKLLTSNGTTGADGLLSEPKPGASATTDPCGQPYVTPNDTGWRLSYYSSSRAEMLNFYVTPAKTLVVRASWAPINLGAIALGVDNDLAIRSLTAAIETRGFKSEEEKSGVDYFMGGRFGQTCMGPVPTGYGQDDAYRMEALYDVPDNARWNANLQVMLGKPVWELSYYEQPDAPMMMKPMPFPMPGPSVEPSPYKDPGYYINNSARGLVDATTGVVIRFSRPSKNYHPVWEPVMESPVPVGAGQPMDPLSPPPPPPSPVPRASAPAP